jgi:hypothetical protein
MATEYRNVVGFPGYRVGDDGSVWTCKVVRGNVGGSAGTHRVLSDTWKPMKLKPDRRGYLTVHLWANGVGKHCKVHRLVLEAFVGPCPEGMEACHSPDRDPANCNLGNLRWDTKSANAKDRVKDGMQIKGERHGMAKLTKDQVIEIRRRHENGERVGSLSSAFSMSHQAISKIINRKRWASV